ncbi:hypothetical protein Tco_1007093 [Tanacetum coccineum]
MESNVICDFLAWILGHECGESKERGFLTTKGRRSGNYVKEKGTSIDGSPDVGNVSEASSFVTSKVKFYDAPITAIIDNRLSAIETKLDNLLMLDSCKTTMCTDSCYRTSYARAMIKLKADVELRDTRLVVVPKFSGEMFTMSTIRVEYEWAPLMCLECKVFGHILDDRPQKIISNISKNSKISRQPVQGPPVGLKPKSTFLYRTISTMKKTKSNGNPKVQRANKATTPTLNTFDTLSALVDEEEGYGNQTPSTNVTLVVARINDVERKMLDGKLVLLDEHGKSLDMKVTNEASPSKPGTSMGDQLVEFDEDKVKFPDEETSRYMSSTGGGGFCEYDLDFYDGYEAQVYDLPEQMQTFWVELCPSSCILDISFGKTQALNEVYGVGSSWDFKDIKDYDLEAEKVFDDTAEAFYKLEFL